MLDKPDKTRELMAILKAAACPTSLRISRGNRDRLSSSPLTVSGVSYLGDVGGIACHVQPEDVDSVIVVSLTHVRVPRTLPFAAEVLAYQKHRIKKLKKQSQA
jgi:hypothetical protein